MKDFKYCKLVISLFLCVISLSVFSQPPKTQIKERKKYVKKYSKTNNLIITVDEKKMISMREFLSLTGDINYYGYYKSNDSVASQVNKKHDVGHIKVYTQFYRDSVLCERRIKEIRSFREQELECFFADDEPVIMFGEKKINRDEFLKLPEDTVAFINYYVTSFFKEFYANEYGNGLVYVCPRKARSNIVYRTSLERPANGRNYLEDFYGPEDPPTYENGNRYAYYSYVRKKGNEYAKLIGLDNKIVVNISCVVHTDGRIDPLFVERMTGREKIDTATQIKLVDKSFEIINQMHPWTAGGGLLRDDYVTDGKLYDPRECHTLIRIPFYK